MLSKKVDINGVAVLAAEVKDMDANAQCVPLAIS